MPPVPLMGSVEGMADSPQGPEWTIIGADRPLSDRAIELLAKILLDQAEAELREEAHD